MYIYVLRLGNDLIVINHIFICSIRKIILK